MKTYKIEFELVVDEAWVIDGLNCSTLKRRIKDELPQNLQPYALCNELFVKNINVKIKK